MTATDPTYYLFAGKLFRVVAPMDEPHGAAPEHRRGPPERDPGAPPRWRSERGGGGRGERAGGEGGGGGGSGEGRERRDEGDGDGEGEGEAPHGDGEGEGRERRDERGEGEGGAPRPSGAPGEEPAPSRRAPAPFTGDGPDANPIDPRVFVGGGDGAAESAR